MNPSIALSEARGIATSREQQILTWYPLVRVIAARWARRLPASVELEELVNYGVLGLMDALERFDAERGVAFKTYASMRIQGAIVDGLRQEDWVPRAVRRKQTHLESARRSLSHRLGRSPTHEELADVMGHSLEEQLDLENEVRERTLMSLFEREPGKSPLVERVGAPCRSLGALENEQLRCMVAELISHLPRKEREVLRLYYFDGMNLREIGEVMGITQGRASQLRTQALKRLRFRARQRLDASPAAARAAVSALFGRDRSKRR